MKEARTFMDDKGQEVHGFYTIIDEDTLETSEEVLFEGVFPIRTPQGPMQMGCRFPEGYTLKQCFEDFEKVATEAVEEKKREIQAAQAEQNLIVTPGQPAKGDIII